MPISNVLKRSHKPLMRSTNCLPNLHENKQHEPDEAIQLASGGFTPSQHTFAIDISLNILPQSFIPFCCIRPRSDRGCMHHNSRRGGGRVCKSNKQNPITSLQQHNGLHQQSSITLRSDVRNFTHSFISVITINIVRPSPRYLVWIERTEDVHEYGYSSATGPVLGILLRTELIPFQTT
ncbi:hypothetical protein JMJ77_0000254 [Colletotrichum scovillei]|uniref:Uncharacterized protein n=1 Tax=Colletotrichum scovillei TaxID=1209932 RepID=A0A9P7R953_9PEZI|nr:hypothetical protein JMJ77_0000254 [Colletotrichum scovillei]KAG7071460.1 hypothetical protein JMJ76_0004332 [Colletotrichum scovillei]KAG7079710.1 hypothetical protein JMJ78_0006815 [Colletotrichum scovillei]